MAFFAWYFSFVYNGISELNVIGGVVAVYFHIQVNRNINAPNCLSD
jgi:hypothetical protein